MGTQLRHCAALSELPGSPGWLLLATGGTDARVTLYVRAPAAAAAATLGANAGAQPPQQQQQLPQQQGFQLACQLAGHENWVRSLAFAAVAGGSAGAPPALLLASASQDRCGANSL